MILTPHTSGFRAGALGRGRSTLFADNLQRFRARRTAAVSKSVPNLDTENECQTCRMQNARILCHCCALCAIVGIESAVVGGGSMWMIASLICGKRAISRSLTTCDRRCASSRLHVGVHPDVQVEEHEVRRAARADVVAAEHFGHGLHHLADVVLRGSRCDRPGSAPSSRKISQHAWPMKPATIRAAAGSSQW